VDRRPLPMFCGSSFSHFGIIPHIVVTDRCELKCRAVLEFGRLTSSVGSKLLVIVFASRQLYLD
jgi:hypothetical protein